MVAVAATSVCLVLAAGVGRRALAPATSDSGAPCREIPPPFDWSQPDTGLLGFANRLLALCRANPAFRRSRFLARPAAGDLRWFTPAATEMTAANWSDPNALAIALYLEGAVRPAPGQLDCQHRAVARPRLRGGQ